MNVASYSGNLPWASQGCAVSATATEDESLR